MRFIGIDPGGNGGVAWINDDGTLYHAVKMPATREDIRRCIFEAVGSQPEYCKVLIEKVGAMPRQGVASTFKFGYVTGLATGILLCTFASWSEVAPNKWQQAFGLRMKGDISATVKKNRHKQKAQELFPQLSKITHATADALLIAEYCRRFERGML